MLLLWYNWYVASSNDVIDMVLIVVWYGDVVTTISVYNACLCVILIVFFCQIVHKLFCWKLKM